MEAETKTALRLPLRQAGPKRKTPLETVGFFLKLADDIKISPGGACKLARGAYSIENRSIRSVTMSVDWDQIGILSNTIGGFDIRTDLLWLLVIAARQGHEGALEAMHIRMTDGKTYAPDDIEALALNPDRKRVRC